VWFLGKIVFWIPSDSQILSAIKEVCPEYFDKALEGVLG